MGSIPISHATTNLGPNISYLGVSVIVPTHGLLRSSVFGLLYRILHVNHKKELPWSLWVRKLTPHSNYIGGDSTYVVQSIGLP